MQLLEHLQKFAFRLLKPSMYNTAIFTVVLTVVATYKALLRVLVRKLLLYFRFSLQALVVVFNQISSIDTFSDNTWEFIKGV